MHKELLLVKLQFMYMTRSPLRVKEVFLDRLCQNIKDIHLRNEELENAFLAIAIMAFGAKRMQRIEFCNKALDALNALNRGFE